MSDDADDAHMMEFDLTDYTEPADLDAAWALVLADLRTEEAAADAASEDDAIGGGGEMPEAEGLPAGFDTWTEHQREDWAWGEGLLRAEQRRRRALLEEWNQREHPERRAANAVRSGWAEVSMDAILDQIAAGTLVLPTPTVGMLSDGSAGLFYPGRVNGIAGESGAGKGWIALVTGAQLMALDGHLYYLDFEDSAALASLRLVAVLGVDPTLLRDGDTKRFHYIHPTKHDELAIADLIEQVATTSGALVVIDSTGESMAAASLKQNHDEEVAQWFQSLAHPLADKGGATVLLLDHMVKAEDGGLWPIGSQRKRAAITGVQYVAEVIDPFSESKNGAVALRVAKDRHGAREARSVATYVQFQHPIESITDLPDGAREIVLSKMLTVEFGPGKTPAQAQADKVAKAATALEHDVSSLDQLAPPPTSQRDVMKRMSWGAKRAMDALKEWRTGQPGGVS